MALPPPTCLEMGAFYPILGVMELSAELLYTTFYRELSLSRFAAGPHAGAARGAPGAPPASAADRPCPEPCQAQSQRQRPKPPRKGGRACSRDGAVLCPAQFPGAPEPLAVHDLIGINSTGGVLSTRL